MYLYLFKLRWEIHSFNGDVYYGPFPIPESFSSGYVAELAAYVQAHKTHPAQHDWKQSRLSDITFSLDVVAGHSAEACFPSLEKLLRHVEGLRNAMLPISGLAPWDVGYSELPAMRLYVGNKPLSGYFFQQSVFLTGMNEEWMHPYDPDTGQPKRVKLQLTFTPTFSWKTGERVGEGGQGSLPQRPWTFKGVK